MSSYRFVMLFLMSFVINQFAFAQLRSQVPLPKEISQDRTRAIGELNREIQLRNQDSSQSFRRPLRPTTEIEDFRYLLMSGSTYFDTADMKSKIARNLPRSMKLVLLVYPGEEASTRAQFSRWIESDRIIIAIHRDASNGFWSRDSFPFPVYLNSSLKVGLVAAKYDRQFEAHTAIASSIGAASSMAQKTHFFVGGNLQADEDGRCFVVESIRLYQNTDETLTNAYGCKGVVRLKWLTGIGDVDEVIKILPNKQILTNRTEYVDQLQELGYQVSMLPSISNYRTYANSIIIGENLFMPSYGVKSDDAAIQVYERFGYKVIPVDSETVSTRGNGSVHCATMMYPDIDLRELMSELNAVIH